LFTDRNTLPEQSAPTRRAGAAPASRTVRGAPPMTKLWPKIVLGLASLVGFSAPAPAQPIAPNDLVIFRVGDGTAALGTTATPVFLDEYTPTGTLVRSIP